MTRRRPLLPPPLAVLSLVGVYGGLAGAAVASPGPSDIIVTECGSRMLRLAGGQENVRGCAWHSLPILALIGCQRRGSPGASFIWKHLSQNAPICGRLPTRPLRTNPCLLAHPRHRACSGYRELGRFRVQAICAHARHSAGAVVHLDRSISSMIYAASELKLKLGQNQLPASRHARPLIPPSPPPLNASAFSWVDSNSKPQTGPRSYERSTAEHSTAPSRSIKSSSHLLMYPE